VDVKQLRLNAARASLLASFLPHAAPVLVAKFVAAWEPAAPSWLAARPPVRLDSMCFLNPEF